MQKIEISDEILKEEKSIVEDLVVAAHNNAKTLLKNKTNEEISKATGNFGVPGFKWPL
jgi:DNA-binding protein YbaB